MQPVSQVATMDEVLGESVSKRRFTMTLLATFAALALALAALGVYGVLSHGVAHRTPELGLRLALGAHPSRLVASVLGESAALAVPGIALGTAGAVSAGHLIESQLYAVTAADAATFGAVSALLVGVSLLAAWLPARRASRVDPLTALRAD
jgi:putative ABC transport system permease protein